MESIDIRPISPTSLSRPGVLTSLSAGALPRLEALREIEAEISQYKAKHEKRLASLDGILEAVDGAYRGLKERERRGSSTVKKEPTDVLPPRPSKPASVPTTLRIPGQGITNAMSVSPTVPTALPTSTSTTPIPSKAVPPRQSSVIPGTSKSSKPKKRRRPEDDEFDVMGSGGASRMSVTPTVKHGGKEHKSKKAKLDDWDSRVNGFRKVIDWSESLKGGLPPHPLRNPIPIPQTDDPGQVNDDFSEQKQPNSQVPAHTYWNYIEPYTRAVKDEDVAFLAFSGEDPEYFELPPLGKHYSHAWEEADRLLFQISSSKPLLTVRPPSAYQAFTHPVPLSAHPGQTPASAISLTNLALPGINNAYNTGTRWDPASMVDNDTTTEEKGSGPLTERIFSSLLFDHSNDKVKIEGTGDDGMRGNGMGRAMGQGTVGDLEERLMGVCKSLGLIMENDEPDYSSPLDDQITSELRRCQRALRQQIALNTARKKRLLSIAQARLAYAEYLETKEGLERTVHNLFTKLGNSGVPKVTKKKKKEKERVASEAAVGINGGAAGVMGLGLVGLDGYLSVNSEVSEAVKVLRDWEKIVGSGFEELESQREGWVIGLPQESIYAGLEDDVQRELRALDGGEQANRGEIEADGDVSMDS